MRSPNDPGRSIVMYPSPGAVGNDDFPVKRLLPMVDMSSHRLLEGGLVIQVNCIGQNAREWFGLQN